MPAVDSEVTHDDAISALLEGEKALTEEDPPEASDVDETAQPEFASEDSPEDADIASDDLEVIADLEEDAETEVVAEDEPIDADLAEADDGEDPIVEHTAESDEFVSSDEDEIEDV